MRQTFQAVRHAYRSEGLPSVLRKALVGIPARLVRWSRKDELLLEKDLTETRGLSFDFKLTLRPLEPRDRPLIESFHRKHRVDRDQEARIAWYFDRGYNGFVAFQSDKPIGYLWWVSNRWSPSENHPHLKTYGIPLGSDDVYAVDFYIAPPYRGGSNALEFFARAQESLHEAGYRRAFGLVATYKTPARWTYAALGWKTVRPMVGYTIFSILGILNGRMFLAKGRMY